MLKPAIIVRQFKCHNPCNMLLVVKFPVCMFSLADILALPTCIHIIPSSLHLPIDLVIYLSIIFRDMLTRNDEEHKPQSFTINPALKNPQKRPSTPPCRPSWSRSLPTRVWYALLTTLTVYTLVRIGSMQYGANTHMFPNNVRGISKGTS